MLYSGVGILALIIHLIINHDMLNTDPGKKIVPAYRSYVAVEIAVAIFYISDIFWGILYEQHLIPLVFADTAVYFIAMTASVLLWTWYVVDYLKEENFFGKALESTGVLLFGFEVVMVVLNFFYPVLYYFDEAGGYHTSWGRYVTLATQVVMMLMTGVYAFAAAAKTSGTMKSRHRTIGIFCLVMIGAIIGQILLPLFPVYSAGCTIGTCLLHSFVLENEKDEYREELEEKLRDSVLHGNYYDLLTGLPGLSYFLKLAEKKRDEIYDNGGSPVMLFMDLSGMKYYNQNHGFAAGDKLLKAFAGLIVPEFGEESCSRIAKDQFLAVTYEDGLEPRLRKMFDDWEKKAGPGCPAIRVGVYADRIGKVNSDTACDRAKVARDSIRNTFVSDIKWFDQEMLNRAEREQYIVSHFEEALEYKWIDVYYQPIVRSTNGRVCDEEALSRWNDPERGQLKPDEFIPFLEESKLIYKLDLYVLDEILLKDKRLKEAGLYIVPQSLNLSRADFESCDMVEEIRKRVDAAGLPHELLSIELTESIIGSDFDYIKTQIDRFSKLGFPVWMDDFGSGYSSLDVLANMHIDLVKIDMRFMQEFENGDRAKIVLTELVRMAISLGIDTVCEGVERKEQVEFLRDIGCAKMQGYYYTPPIPVEKILERYEKHIQIGFEDPAETAYYDAIGKINLYDLSMIAKEEENEFRHYFSTIPMAIIEVKGNQAKFTRTNQAYRDFMKRTFHINLADMVDAYGETEKGPGYAFAMMLRQCCKDGGRTVFDETMPDGSRVHSFMRRIAEDPVTGTTAAAVAVLAIDDAKEHDMGSADERQEKQDR